MTPAAETRLLSRKSWSISGGKVMQPVFLWSGCLPHDQPFVTLALQFQGFEGAVLVVVCGVVLAESGRGV